ncbi:LysE family translocator [Niveispirillum cyanobacteriorum]|uniref:Homoserine lactone transporter n=1 Tax=Niveispirillum cyanobacteriorum TaxID=1612173 RepID=A0A2K9NCI7_9PROT|nr:LysE family translocator [Niveispirillum cyanobacteriorum]AUN30828.1 homoserine lactone transporter [Niveispirillum cyanobacteriorum]GGE79946.1 amino acid transporter [Niveispirillum cyanobacteriorum]
MISTQTLVIFLTTCFFLSATPGPNMLSALSMGMRHGLVGAAWGGIGMCLSLGLLAGLSALGVGVLLKTSPLAFTIFKWVGVAYLTWLGIQAWRAPIRDEVADMDAAMKAGPDRRGQLGLLGQGLLITLSNPKALVFMAAFFPQFIDPARPMAPQLTILVVTMLIIEFGWIMTYAVGGKGLALRLTGPVAQRWLNRMTGALLIGAGLLLAMASL